MARKPVPVSETVTCDHRNAGTIEGVTGAIVAYGPDGQHVGTFPAVADARRALFQLHQDSQAALLAAQ